MSFDAVYEAKFKAMVQLDKLQKQLETAQKHETKTFEHNALMHAWNERNQAYEMAGKLRKQLDELTVQYDKMTKHVVAAYDVASGSYFMKMKEEAR